MNDENDVQGKDSTTSNNKNASDLKEAAQQLMELSKPKSYGTVRLVNAQDYAADSDEEILNG